MPMCRCSRPSCRYVVRKCCVLLSCCYDGVVITKPRFAMTSKSWISRLGALLVAFVLTVAPSVSPGHAVEDARKVVVVSFGLFGDQGVFRNEAAGAAQVVAGRFGNGPIN